MNIGFPFGAFTGVKRSLGDFKRSQEYTNERYYGVKSGYMAAYAWDRLITGYNIDVGFIDPSSMTDSKNNSFRYFNNSAHHFSVNKLMTHLAELKTNKKKNYLKIRDMQRQLIALRLLKIRFNEELKKFESHKNTTK